MLNRELAFAYITSINVGLVFLNIPPAISILMDLYGVSYTGISVLMSGLLWSHALMQIPAGMVADRLGIRRALRIAMAFLVVGNLLPAAAPLMSIALLGRVLAGVGTALTFVTLMKLIAANTPQGRTGTYQAFFAGLFSFGNILAYFLVPRLAPAHWQWVYLVPGLYSLALLLLCFGVRPAAASTSPGKPLPLRKLAGIKAGWMIGLYHALSWGTMINLGNWIPSLLAEFKFDSTPARLAWGGVLVLLISGIGRISGGFVLLRVPPLRVAHGSILILALIFIGLFTARAPELLLPLAILAALFSSVNFGALFHLGSAAVEPRSIATIIGFVNFLANIGAVLFTLLFGFSKDFTGTFALGFGVLALIALVALPLGRSVLGTSAGPPSDRR
jgi:NNP family nitrate/nitrite transporter-like MFS transporter